MTQDELRKHLEAILADLRGVYLPDADVRQSIVEWLLRVAEDAAFGHACPRRSGAVEAFAVIEGVAREPIRLEARIWRGRSRVRAPDADFFVEFREGDALLAEGASPILSLAVMHAARSLARA